MTKRRRTQMTHQPGDPDPILAALNMTPEEKALARARFLDLWERTLEQQPFFRKIKAEGREKKDEEPDDAT